MFAAWPILVALGLGYFLIGTVVGSFVNVCIYRIPWQKSVVWPSSRCPACSSAIAVRDNIPIVSWIALRGECRNCGSPISVRYPLVEALVGLLFLGAFVVDVIAGPRGLWGSILPFQLVAAAYHAMFLALLVAATFIDYDLLLIPDEITRTGMIVGISLGTLWPEARPSLWTPVGRGVPVAPSHLEGLWVGILGLAVGAGLVLAVRMVAGFILRREAMGLGDVTLLAMVGSFLGWQAAVLTFFLAPFFGLAHAAWKMLAYLKKWLRGGQLSSADREIPFGPYLSMAAASLFLVWPWFWQGWAKGLFGTLYVLFWWMLGINVNPPN
jgi:leader peptidase (prepilin peptidase)/N-methyltransferase